MIDTNKILIQDEDGSTKEMEILFTFDDDNRNKSYVVFTDPQDEEGQAFACSYNEEGQMEPVEDADELAMVEEVLGAFMDEMEDYGEEE